MCTQECQTFLWGGAGTPTHDEDGRCFCVCENDSWSDKNILGRASCVPAKAHLAYGLVGLTLATASLCHTVYHLRRQLRFHRENILASTSTAETCRRHMHIAMIMNNLATAGYFVMVLGHEMRWSVVLLGIAQTFMNPCAIMEARLWMYDTDPQHMNKSPPILILSNYLETSLGAYMSVGLFTAIPGVAVIFDAIGRIEVGIKLAAMGHVLLELIMGSLFWICGNSLRRVVGDSLRRSSARRNSAPGAAAIANEGGTDTLMAVRKTVTRMTFFIVQQSYMVAGITLFAIFSPYGIAAPMLLFGITMAIMPPIWNMIGVQMYARRTRLSSSRRSVIGFGASMYSSRFASGMKIVFFRNHRATVIPAETTAATALC